jgi:hypothetical protein
MIKVQNISPYKIGISSSYVGTQGRPLYIGLEPSLHMQMTQEELKKWGNGAKADLASYVQRGQLLVTTMTAVHVVDDLGNVPAPFGAFDLQSAYDTADDLRNVYNTHLLSLAVHGAQDLANPETLAKPGSLALLTAFITSFQGNYTAHIALGAATHTVADSWNPLVPAPVGTLDQNIAALRELYGRFSGHKKQSNPAGTTTLNPNDIITYV